MPTRAFPFLLAMVFGLFHQYAHGQPQSRTALEDFESDIRRFRKMNADMVKRQINMDEMSERSYREWMPILEKRIAGYRAAGNETEARAWERVKATFEKDHAAVVERQRAGYRNPDTLDAIIVRYQLMVLKCAFTGQSAENALEKLNLLVLVRDRMRYKDTITLAIRIGKTAKAFSASLLNHR